jgi:hypothetical protein
VNLSTAFPGREAKTGMSILSIKSIKPAVAAVSIVCGKFWIEAKANLYRFKNCKWPERAETRRNSFPRRAGGPQLQFGSQNQSANRTSVAIDAAAALTKAAVAKPASFPASIASPLANLDETWRMLGLPNALPFRVLPLRRSSPVAPAGNLHRKRMRMDLTATLTALPHSVWLGEFMGTFVLLLLGGGVNASVNLKKTYAEGSGWIVITTGWGLAVLCGVLTAQAFGSSGAHLNPAISLLQFALVSRRLFSTGQLYWSAQLLGAMAGATLVWLFFFPHWAVTPDPATKLGVFCTSPAIPHSALEPARRRPLEPSC